MLRVVNDILQARGLMMKRGTVVDATLIAAPSSTKNAEGERDPEMKQARKGNQWYFGMKAHLDVDAHSGLVHSVVGTSASVNDVTQAGALLHGEEEVAFVDAGYQGVHKRIEAGAPQWHVAMRPGLRRKLNPFIEPHFAVLTREKWKASVRPKVEHPFRVLKRQVRLYEGGYRGLAKNTAQIVTLFALSNLGMARRSLMGAQGLRPQRAWAARIASAGPFRRCEMRRNVVLAEHFTRHVMSIASIAHGARCADLP